MATTDTERRDDGGLTDPVQEDVEPRRADYAPEGVEHKTGTVALLKRTFKEFQEDNLTDWAAALTYYGLLALFPALIALVSVVGLVFDPQEITSTITEVVDQLGPARLQTPSPGRSSPLRGTRRPRESCSSSACSSR